MNQAQQRLTVTLVRHGETFLNAQRVMQGQSDAPLSQIGIDQATKLGKYLLGKVKFTKAYSSDLQRAYITANLILNEAHINSTSPPLIKDMKLRERNYGDAEGKPFTEFAERAAKANLSLLNFIPNGGESPDEISKRAAEFFDNLCKLSNNNTNTTDGENILIVSHGGWIQCLMRYLNGSPNIYKLKHFSPSDAIRIHHNTATTVMHITSISENPVESKYEVEFVQVNNIDHLK